MKIEEVVEATVASVSTSRRLRKPSQPPTPTPTPTPTPPQPLPHPLHTLPPHAPLTALTATRSNRAIPPANPTIINQIPRSPSADMVDGRDGLVAPPQALEFLVEAEDGPLRRLVHVAGPAAPGCEVLAAG